MVGFAGGSGYDAGPVSAQQSEPRDPQLTRQRLIDGAQRAVVAHGLRELTVEQCVRAAGLSRRTFYQYFRDREAVLEALYERVANDITDRVNLAVDAASDPMARITAGIECYLDIQQHGGRLIAELQVEAANPASRLWPIRQRALDRMGRLLDVHVRKELGAAPDPLIYLAMYDALEGLVLQARNLGPLAPDRRAHVSSIIRPFWVSVLLGARHVPQVE